MRVIVASFKVKPDCIAAFIEAAKTDAESSVANEPGCHQFDVNVDPKNPTHFTFYEVYEDQDAIDAHRESPHFKIFFDAIQNLIEERSPLILNRVLSG
jgi:quinol monooxygenase YgiN